MNRRDFLRHMPAWAGLGAWSRTPASPARQADVPATPAVAFYYGSRLPWDELRLFDWVVLEPEHALAERQDVAAALGSGSIAVAYVSAGEVHPQRPYAGSIPKTWIRVRNEAWGSWVIDQAAPGWAEFFLDRIVAPLWQAGFRAFFLDTLDSYQLFARTDEARTAQAGALRRILSALVARFPGARLIMNRGFELLDEQLAPHLLAVAAESLYRRYDAGDRRYSEVPDADRKWLLDRFAQVRRLGVPVIAIDYVPAGDRTLARETARRIAASGAIPWVSDPGLHTLGVGSVEVVPRRVLLLHDPVDPEQLNLKRTSAHRHGALPLEYLGLVPEYREVGAEAPTEPLAGRYAAVVLYLDDANVADAAREVLVQASREGVPVVVLGQAPAHVLGALGVETGEGSLRAPLQLRRAPGIPPGEADPRPIEGLPLLRAGVQSRVWLWVEDSTGERTDVAAVTPWGGYLLPGYGVYLLPGGAGARWVVDPIEFLRQALRLGEDPMPDVTTCVGRRAFFAHFDGDGWLNRCNLPGTPTAGEYLWREYLTRYHVPVTASLIVGEVSAQGVYASMANLAQESARRVLALPHVQAASHTWSHPFQWGVAVGAVGGEGQELAYGVHLRLPGYEFDLRTEIAGSKAWIEERLCPPGKAVDLLLWSGDCNPPAAAIRLAREAGMGTMNGGGGALTRIRPSITQLWPMGISKREEYQVYAAASNEMDYTNNWQAPFTGYERVIDTFAMTELPRRIKPVNLYFHPYLITQPAGAQALHDAFRWVQSQPLHAITARRYHDLVHAWRAAAVGRQLGGGWRMHSPAPLRQWRQPASAPLPSVLGSQGLAGWNEHAGLRYLHVTDERAHVLSGPPGARVVDANADIASFSRTPDGGWRARLQGHLPVELRLDLPPGWQVRGNATVRRQGAQAVLTTDSTILEVQCRPG
ncbi:MAG TPA: endo alpha-1,4 polygalactosaminidase [Burkholderiaceae bacterium]|nr:endo alpha-1,4 polygalactosaminidase [Burkholderiaceae bacterium]